MQLGSFVLVELLELLQIVLLLVFVLLHHHFVVHLSPVSLVDRVLLVFVVVASECGVEPGMADFLGGLLEVGFGD